MSEDRFHNEEPFCTTGCGRSNRMNPVTLGRDEIGFLFTLERDFGGSVERLREMKLEGHIYARCSALRYWGLTVGDRGSHAIAPFGYRFMADKVRIHRTLWMFDKRVVDREGPMVTCSDILREGYKDYETILEEVRRTRIAPADVIAANVARRIRHSGRKFDQT